MTQNEKNLLEAVHGLLDSYNPDFLTAYDMEDFNDKLIMTLSQFNVTLDRYHDMLLEEIEDMVEAGD